MNMRNCLLTAALAAASPLMAQIGIDISLNRNLYMQYEPVYACVSLRNDTGKPLLFGKDPRFQGFVLFEIRDRDGRIVPQKKDVGISVTGLIMRPGEVKRMVIPIHKYYELDKTGRYTVNAFVSHNLLPHEYESRTVNFRIEDGLKVWSRTVGLPNIDEDQKTPAHRTRTYTIKMLREGQTQHYYLVVEDDKYTYGVMRIGRQIGCEKYSAEIDMLSRIHLLMPISPKIFHYLSFSIDGENIDNSYWKITSTIPMLYRDPTSGIVNRIGGEEARKGVDFRDPDEGRQSLAQMMTADELREAENAPPPAAPRNPGTIDLGRDMEIPSQPADK